MSDLAALQRQLKGDLLLAMKARDTIAVSALRSVLSALDNASAVPASTAPAPVFGRNGDVPRRELSDSDCRSIISAELSARASAAREYARLGRDDIAARLRAEQAVIERYARCSPPANDVAEEPERQAVDGPVAYRRADLADAAALAAFAERTFRDTFADANDPADMSLHCEKNFGPDVQLRELADPGLVTTVVEQDGELIGFAQVRLNSPIECVVAQRPSELYRFYIAQRWHGSGIAHELMKDVLATVHRLASDRIWLGVWERNARAVKFYQKFGFAVVGEHAFVLGRDRQRDLVMVLDVAAAVMSSSTSR